MQGFLYQNKKSVTQNALHFPYKSQGLTERQAAAHLLSRFSFGATPNQIDEVVKMGLENWFSKQLESSFLEDTLQNRLLIDR